MDADTVPPASCLFTLRVWRAEAADGGADWRGQLQHVLSGESRYFQGWPALVACVCALLPEPGRPPLSGAGDQDPQGEQAGS
jgi:hypothetical protein